MCVKGQSERADLSYDTIAQAVSYLKMTVTKMTLRFGFFFFDCWHKTNTRLIQSNIMEDQIIIDAFKALDSDNSGMINAKELRQLLTTMGDKMTAEEVDNLIEDAGGGSSIDYAKLVKKLNKAAKGG